MNVSTIDPLTARQVTEGLDVHPQFPGRWSPRAFDGQPLDEKTVLTLLEAARWAPSCFNAQPWRFAYVLRDGSGWDALLATLVDANRIWAQRAGALLAVISRSRYERNDQPAPTHGFDAGAAWMSLALQAAHLGLVSHGMQGFDQEQARSTLKVPEVYDIPAIIAVGAPGWLEDLPDDYRSREQPSDRKALGEIAFAGDFTGLEP